MDDPKRKGKEGKREERWERVGMNREREKGMGEMGRDEEGRT